MVKLCKKKLYTIKNGKQNKKYIKLLLTKKKNLLYRPLTIVFIYWSIASCVMPFCLGAKIFCELFSLPILPTIFGISLFVQLLIILSSFVSVALRLLFTIVLLLFKLLSLSFLQLLGTSVGESSESSLLMHELLRFCTFCANFSQCSLFSSTPFTNGCSLFDNVPKACQSNIQLKSKFNFSYENYHVNHKKAFWLSTEHGWKWESSVGLTS